MSGRAAAEGKELPLCRNTGENQCRPIGEIGTTSTGLQDKLNVNYAIYLLIIRYGVSSTWDGIQE